MVLVSGVFEGFLSEIDIVEVERCSAGSWTVDQDCALFDLVSEVCMIR